MTWTVNETTTNQMADDFNSLTELNHIRYTKQQELLTVFGNSISESLNNFGLWFARASGGGVVFLYNAGVGGDTTADMIARLNEVPDNTTLVTVMEATNDAASAVTAEQHAQNMKDIFENMISRNIRTLLLIAPPNDDNARSQLVDTMNLYDYVTAQSMGIPVIDVWSQFTDPSNGSWIAGASSDGTHPDPITEQGAGNSLQEYWLNNNFFIPLPRNNANSGINPNSCFLGDGNADNIPDNWATNGNQNSTALSNTMLGLGNTWQTNWVNSALFMNSSRFAVVAGDRYQFVIRFNCLFNSGSTPLNVYLEYDTPVGIPPVDRVYFINQASLSVTDTTLSVDFVVPSGVSTIRYAINGDAGAYDLDINLAQAQMYNLSDHTL